MCNTICVMYAGRIVERGPTEDIFEAPKHPYTMGLIRSVPRLDQENKGRLYSIPGQPPNVIDLPDCCPFYPRCEHTMDICKAKYPALATFENGHSAACWLYTDVALDSKAALESGAPSTREASHKEAPNA